MILRIGQQGCFSCSLYTHRKDENVVKNWINTESEICFHGLGPGETEAKELQPFIGAAGQQLRQAIGKTDIRVQDVSFTNAVLCQPPLNKIDKTMTVPCHHHFEESIKAMPNLKLVVLLGAEAYQSVVGSKPTIKNVYMRPFQLPKYGNINFVTNYHPSFILRSPSKENKDLFYNGIKTAVDLLKASKKLVKQKKYVKIYTEDALNKIMPFILKQSSMSLDTEATSKDSHVAKLLVVAVSFEASTGIGIPYNKIVGREIVPYWPAETMTKLTNFYKILVNKPLVLQNSKYDSLVFNNNLGFPINNVGFDTMLASHLLNSNETSNLEDLVMRYLPEEAAYKTDFWNRFTQTEVDIGAWVYKVNYDKLMDYCISDADCTFQLAQILARRL
jgi:uracil-DNA glycosylase family 4